MKLAQHEMTCTRSEARRAARDRLAKQASWVRQGGARCCCMLYRARAHVHQDLSKGWARAPCKEPLHKYACIVARLRLRLGHAHVSHQSCHSCVGGSGFFVTARHQLAGYTRAQPARLPT